MTRRVLTLRGGESRSVRSDARGGESTLRREACSALEARELATSRGWSISNLRRLRRYRFLDFLANLIRSRNSRSYWFLRLIRPQNLFQPFVDTYPDRYPQIFEFVRAQLGDGPHVRLLSFGCSTGEEVFSLRRYFAAAQIRGLDINPLNIVVCLRRRLCAGDQRMSFAVGRSVEHEQTAAYDAVFCMAVLRHGDLSYPDVQTCDHRITFAAFERTVDDLARCVKDGGLLIIQHSNFRFCDTVASTNFRTVLRVDNGPFVSREPLFGPDNRRLDSVPSGEVVFRKSPSLDVRFSQYSMIVP